MVSAFAKVIVTGGLALMDPFTVAALIAGTLKFADDMHHPTCADKEASFALDGNSEADDPKGWLYNSTMKVVTYCDSPDAQVPKDGEGTKMIEKTNKAGRISRTVYTVVDGIIGFVSPK